MMTSSKSHVTLVTIFVYFERSHAKFHSQDLTGWGYVVGGYRSPRLFDIKKAQVG